MAPAEDLTAETFLAVADAALRDDPPPLSVAWTVGVARHKLADHWRRQARDQRSLRAVADHHRAALTLRYLDDLSVPEAAARHGDIVYLSLEVVDAAKARAFYRSVLGWRFGPGHVEDGWQVEGVAPMIGVVGGRDQATVVRVLGVH